MVAVSTLKTGSASPSAPGTKTVSVVEPDFPPIVAVITAVPTVTPLATPLAETVATAGLLVVQVIGKPVTSEPLASRGVAAATAVVPVAIPAGVIVTVTDATIGVVTVIIAEPDLPPPTVAVIAALPTDTPATMVRAPVGPTDAIAALL